MPLFICDRCKCVDNTATSDFWLQARRGSTERLCTECRTGTWHNPVPQGSPRRPTGHLASEHQAFRLNHGVLGITSGARPS
jgi:hypothetical protein